MDLDGDDDEDQEDEEDDGKIDYGSDDSERLRAMADKPGRERERELWDDRNMMDASDDPYHPHNGCCLEPGLLDDHESLAKGLGQCWAQKPRAGDSG